MSPRRPGSNGADDGEERSAVDLDKQPTVEAQLELDPATDETSASTSRRQLEHGSIKADRVVVANRPAPAEGTQSVQISRRRPPGRSSDTAGCDREPLVEDRNKARQDLVGTREVVCSREAQHGHQAILASSPKTLDPALGLRASSRDRDDPEFGEGPADLGSVGAHRGARAGRAKDARSIPIDRVRQAIAGGHLVQDREIARSVLVLAKDRSDDGSAGIVDPTHQGQAPVHGPQASRGASHRSGRAGPAWAMRSRRLRYRADRRCRGDGKSCASEYPLQRRAADVDRLFCGEQFGQMAVIDASDRDHGVRPTR